MVSVLSLLSFTQELFPSKILFPLDAIEGRRRLKLFLFDGI
jgi:hypothetical protein